MLEYFLIDGVRNTYCRFLIEYLTCLAKRGAEKSHQTVRKRETDKGSSTEPIPGRVREPERAAERSRGEHERER